MSTSVNGEYSARKHRIAALESALRPFVDAYNKAADHIGDSDLYPEQPRSVHVTLGDCRNAARVLHEKGTP